MKTSKTVRNFLGGAVFLSGMIYGVTPPDNELNVYFGLLHAHTLISDGSGTPEEAYKMAKENGLDFFAVTPHNHAAAENNAKDRRDGVLIATNPLLYNGDENVPVTRNWTDKEGKKHTEQLRVKPLLSAAKAATTEAFCAIYGQEFSTISSGNHMNVLGIDEVITAADGDFDELLQFIKKGTAQGKPAPILQMNHPDVSKDLFYKGKKASEKNKMYNDYGLDDLGPHFSDFVKDMSPYLHLIELLSGIAMKEERSENHRYHLHENDYYFYLTQGLKISPSVGQDNHYKTWGSVTDARMGVLAENLTQAALFRAIRQNRTFVTTDKNLKTVLYVNGAVMGASITAGEESQLRITINVEDADEPDATYQVEVYSGEINPELDKKATNWKASDGFWSDYSLSSNGVLDIGDFFTPAGPNFVYLKVIQDDGDEAWTAPVWINYDAPFVYEEDSDAPLAVVTYYWSKSNSSKVYHREGCVSLDRILSANLVVGSAPPNGRELHNCHIITVEDI